MVQVGDRVRIPGGSEGNVVDVLRSDSGVAAVRVWYDTPAGLCVWEGDEAYLTRLGYSCTEEMTAEDYDAAATLYGYKRAEERSG